MPTKAPAKKSGIKSGEIVPQPHGGALRVGSKPGNKGGTGRPPAAFKDFLAKLRANPKALEALERGACDETLKSFGSAWKLITEYDPDKPAARKELSGKVEVTVRVAREGRRQTAG